MAKDCQGSDRLRERVGCLASLPASLSGLEDAGLGSRDGVGAGVRFVYLRASGEVGSFNLTSVGLVRTGAEAVQISVCSGL